MIATKAVTVTESTHEAFAQALIAVVEPLRFVPALKDGRPIQAILTIEREFRPAGRDGVPTEEEQRMLRREQKKPDTILTGRAIDTPPKLLSQKQPFFPLMARATASEGEAMIEFIVDENGFVRLPRVVSASHPSFGAAAVQAASEWRFEPPTAQGKKAAVKVRAPVKFTFTEEKTAAVKPD